VTEPVPSPASFCLRCRAITDLGQPCECDAGRPLALEDGADDAIDEAIFRAPNVDRNDLVLRVVVSALLGPGAATFVCGFLGLLLAAMVPAVQGDLPWLLGVPLGAVTLLWTGLIVWSTFEQQRPYYVAGPMPDPLSGEPTFRGRLGARSTILAAEVRPLDEPGSVHVRDAYAADPFVIERSGQRLEMPAGRLRVEAKASRWRLGASKGARGPLVATWSALPEGLTRAGLLHRLELAPGTEVEVFGGELDSVARTESSFREPALETLHYEGKRPCVRVVG
jgi:hypothetical protein